MTGFLSNDAIRRWRELGKIPGWETTYDWHKDTRSLFASLTPPLIPEDEFLLFSPAIWNGGSGEQTIAILAVRFKGQQLWEGCIVATDSRLVIASRQKHLIYQVPYTDIKAVYYSGNAFTVRLASSEEILIDTKVPDAGALDYISMLAGGAVALSVGRGVEAKREKAHDFKTLFAGFFNEIADENKLRQRG